MSISQNFLQLKEIRFLVELFCPRTCPLSSLPGVHKYSPTPSVTERLNTHTGVTQLWSLVQKYSPTQIIKSKGFKIFQSHSVFIRKIFLDTNILCSCFPSSFVRNYLQSCTAVCDTIGARGVCTRRGDSLHTSLLVLLVLPLHCWCSLCRVGALWSCTLYNRAVAHLPLHSLSPSLCYLC